MLTKQQFSEDFPDHQLYKVEYHQLELEPIWIASTWVDHPDRIHVVRLAELGDTWLGSQLALARKVLAWYHRHYPAFQVPLDLAGAAA